MSEFEDQLDSTNVICPYCKYEYQPEAEDYSEDGFENECSKCGMFFLTYQSFLVDHHADPDCELNDLKHKWEPRDLAGNRTHDFCSVCDKCKPYEMPK